MALIRENLRRALLGAGIGSIDVCRTLLVAETGVGLAGRYATGVFRQLLLYAAVGFAFAVFSQFVGAVAARGFRDTIRSATRGEFVERTVFVALWITAMLFGVLQQADESVFSVVAFSAVALTAGVLFTYVRTGPRGLSPAVRGVRGAWFTLLAAAAALSVFAATRLGLDSLAERATAGWRTAATAAPRPHPDVVLITADTLRADRLSTYGGKTAHTPNLDALAAQSLQFDNMTAQSPWTRSSFGSIWTGTTPSVHGANWRILRGADGKDATRESHPLNADLPTLPGVFADAGYLTVGVNNNVQTSARFGFSRGFTTWIDVSSPLHVPDDSLLCRSVRRLFDVATCPLSGNGSGRYPYLPADRLTPILLHLVSRAQNAEAPVFLWLHYMDPHVPYNFHDGRNPPLDYETLRQEIPRDPGAARDRLERAYDAEIEFMDRHLGKVLDGISESPRLRNAVVVFTSDHGEELVERWRPAAERAPDRWYESRGYGHGHTMKQELLHVPLTIRLPDKTGAGRRVRLPAQHTDLLATLAGIAGIDGGRAPTGGGRDLVGLLAAPDPDLESAPVFAEHSLYGPEMKAAQQGPLKIVMRTADGSREFHDLAADPGELRVFPYEETVGGRTLTAEFDRWLAGLPADRDAAGAEDDSVDDASLQQQLEALGYVER